MFPIDNSIVNREKTRASLCRLAQMPASLMMIIELASLVRICTYNAATGPIDECIE